jgi:DNA-binding NarL/FixJ family response regulator
MIKVGIVEDNRTLREGYATLIDRTPGMECVCTCMTVEEALEKVPESGPDVVLMDIQLPDGTGIECTIRLKEILPSLLIVVVTVYADADRIFRALKSGACGYVLKRAKPERIIAAIQSAYDGDVPMTPEIARTVIGHFHEQAKGKVEVENLTEREVEVLKYVMNGLINKEIASQLCVSVSTIKFHLEHIFEKLHVSSRTEAAMKYRQHLDPE